MANYSCQFLIFLKSERVDIQSVNPVDEASPFVRPQKLVVVDRWLARGVVPSVLGQHFLEDIFAKMALKPVVIV